MPNGTGGLLQGLNQDSGDVEAAIGDKLGQLIKSLSTFVAGGWVCFVFERGAGEARGQTTLGSAGKEGSELMVPFKGRYPWNFDVFCCPARIPAHPQPWLVMFPAGFALAFVKGWDMTLVMLGCIPLMGVMGAIAARVTAKASVKVSR